MNLEDKCISDEYNSEDLCILSWWIYLWKEILSDWKNLDFQNNELNNYFKNTKNIESFFSKNQFFYSGKYGWPYSLSNAELILEKAKYHKHLYEFLLPYQFHRDLSLHEIDASLKKINSDYDESSFLEIQIGNSIFTKSKFVLQKQNKKNVHINF